MNGKSVMAIPEREDPTLQDCTRCGHPVWAHDNRESGGLNNYCTMPNKWNRDEFCECSGQEDG